MKLLIDRRTVLAGMASVAFIKPSFAMTTHNIEMLNADPDDRSKRMVFRPLIQSVEVGDTVTFVPTDKGHNCQSIKDMIPEGAEAWKSRINQEVSVTFEVPGVYGYICQPHAALGMVGLIIVRGDGMMDNVEAAKAIKHRGRAAKVWEEIWATVDADNLLA